MGAAGRRRRCWRIRRRRGCGARRRRSRGRGLRCLQRRWIAKGRDPLLLQPRTRSLDLPTLRQPHHVHFLLPSLLLRRNWHHRNELREDCRRYRRACRSHRSSTRLRSPSSIGTSASSRFSLSLVPPCRGSELMRVRRFVTKEELSDDLNKARKDGYLEKQDFLQRTEDRREEDYDKSKRGRR